MSKGALSAVMLAIILVVAAILAGCGRGGGGEDEEAEDVQLELQVSPDSPIVGPAVIDIALWDADGDPVDGADLEVIGDMTDAGMQPVVVDATGLQQGRYVSEAFEFTIGGDWVITVRGTLPDGSSIERRFDVSGVAG